MLCEALLRSLRIVVALTLVSGLLACIGVPAEPFHAADRRAALEASMRAGDFDESDSLVDRHDDVLSDEVALGVAIRAGLLPAVKHYSARADVNASLDLDGTTPLIRAVKSAPRADLDDIVTLLLQAGADPRIDDNFGRDAVDYAGFEGDLALAQHLESGGQTEYVSDRAQHIIWLPEQDWRNIELEGPPQGARSSRVLRQSPLRAFNDGRPDLLLASAWVPRAGPTDVGPFTGLRFHVDGTGEVMRFFPRENRTEPADAASLAWDYESDRLRFMVVSPEFAAYCESAVAGPGRFGVSCNDYAALGTSFGALQATTTDGVARRLLDDVGQRASLRELGKTQAVLESAAESVCKPKRASSTLRAGLPARAASVDSLGSWVVFDGRRYKAYAPKNAAVCTQREARAAAFYSCTAEGGRCRSVGGCAPGEAVALASVDGHGWGSLGCGASLDLAKQRALAACQEQAGCDCQVLFTSEDGGIKPAPRSCRRPANKLSAMLR